MLEMSVFVINYKKVKSLKIFHVPIPENFGNLSKNVLKRTPKIMI
jgi:hypothetical protein